MTDGRHVDPNLMGPPCLKLACNQTCRAEVFLKPPMGRGVPTALPAHDRHFLPMARITADRGCDLSCTRIEGPPSKRQIFALQGAGAAVVGKEFGQAPMRRVGLGDDQKSRRVLVQPVHNPRPLDPADTRQARSAMSDQSVDQRAGRMAWRWMDNEPGRLVDHDQMLVLVDDGKLDVLAGYGRFLSLGGLEGDARARRKPRRGIAGNAFVDPHFARLDQRLEPCARQSNSSCRRRLAQEPIEPLARVVDADVEDLLTFGRRQRSEGCGPRRRVFQRDLNGLGVTALGALLRLGVHARSRRRDRPGLVSVAGGATRGPSAATIASRSGRAPALWASRPRRIAATWAGVLPQQPPTMRAPQSAANPAYVSISSGVPE